MRALKLTASLVGLLAVWLLMSAQITITPARPPWQQAGTGTQYGPPTLELHSEVINVANAADTVYVTSTPYSLPANTLAASGDELEVDLVALQSAAASTRSYKCNIGYSAFVAATGTFTGGNTIYSGSFATASINIQLTGHITRTTNATTGAVWTYAISGPLKWTALTTPDFSVANNILCAANDGTGNAAAVTLQTLRIRLRPAHTTTP